MEVQKDEGISGARGCGEGEELEQLELVKGVESNQRGIQEPERE